MVETSILNLVQKPASGTLYVTGKAKTYGELGLHDTSQVDSPRPIPELEHEPIIDIACSSLHSLAIDRKGRIWSWGCNEFGALGRTDENTTYPQPITHPSMRHIKFKKVACGNSVSLAISTKNQLYGWGRFNSKSGGYGFLPNVEYQPYPRIINETAKLHFLDIAAGASHCLALEKGGNVYSWGCGELNQLGYDTSQDWQTNKECLIPRKLHLQDIVSIQCGAFHSIAISVFGQVYTWGLNHFQQCGLYDLDSNDTNQTDVIVTPTLLPYFKKRPPFKLTKKSSTLGRPKKRHADEAFASDNEGDGFQIERSGEPRAIGIAAGDYHSLALMNNNKLVVWGRCEDGQLGITLDNVPGSFAEGDTNKIFAIGAPYPSPFDYDDDIKDIKCGSNHTVVISRNGRVWGFGESSNYQFGIRDEGEHTIIPTLIQPINEKGKVIRAGAGGDYTFFLVKNENSKST